MLSAQDEAFLRLAIDRGALAGELLPRLQSVPTPPQGGVQALVDGGHLTSLEATGLLRELVGLSFACAHCPWRGSYEALASLPRFACPCGGPLLPARGAASAGSGSFPFPAPERSRGPEDSDFVHQAFGSSRRSLPQPGQRLASYLLLRELGRGANGVVFLAQRDGLEEQCALKVLLEDTAPDAETVARFELEAAIGAKLQDPGVISVFDVGRVDDCLYYAMEYAPGQDLKAHLRERGKLPWREALDLCHQLARTLAHCHERSVIHRDLKPGNVILDTNLKCPRVTDFGLARDRTLAQTMTATGDWLGTPYYMSPEQFRGEMDLDHRSDIYALGVILYEALTGERPYAAKSAQELMELVLEGRPPNPRDLVSDLPPGLDYIAQRALASEREERYPDASALAEDLLAVLEGKRIGAPNTRFAALALVVVAGVFALAALGVYRYRLAQVAAAAPTRSPSDTRARTTPSEHEPPGPDTPRPASEVLERWETWAGTLDLEPFRTQDPPPSREWFRALRAAAKLGRAAQTPHGTPWSELLILLDSARESAPEWSAFQAQLNFQEARLLLARGRSRAALALLEGRQSPRALWLRAQARRQAGELEQYGDLVPRVAAGPEPQASLGKAALRRSALDLEGALELLNKKSLADLPSAQIELAETLWEVGESRPATSALQVYLNRWGPSPRALLLAGDLHLALDELGLSSEAYDRAARLLEQDASPALDRRRSLAYLRLEQNSAAIKLLDARIPYRTEQEELSAEHAELLLLRAVAHVREGSKALARDDLARATAKNPAIATSLPDFLSDEDGLKIMEALSPGPPAGGEGDMQKAMKTVTRMFTNEGSWFKLRPLDDLPQSTSERLQASSDAPQVRRDLATATLKAAQGEPWKEILFYLSRALESGLERQRVRAAWLRLALGRGQALEALAKRLAGDLEPYGLSDEEGACARAELLFLQGRTGESLAAFRALEGEGKTRVEVLAQTSAAYLEGDFAGARARGHALTQVWSDGRGEALAGLAEIALNEREAAAQSQRVAYELLGGSDFRVLALRAALTAGAAGTSTVDLLSGLKVGDEARLHLRLGGQPAEVLTLWALAESDHKVLREFFASRLVVHKDTASAPFKLLLGYSELRQRKERESCLAPWRAARALDPDLPLPTHYRSRFAEAYGSERGLEELR